MNPEISRRDALHWLASASVLIATLPTADGLGEPAIPSGAIPLAQPYGTDPALLKSYKPGDLWPLTLTEAQRATVTALADLIIPADDRSPAASRVGVPAFIDEWLSAPYAQQQLDRPILLEGLLWLETESHRRFQTSFAGLELEQQTQIADDICALSRVKLGLEKPTAFFHLFRNLTMGGFYTSPAGMRDIGFIGNIPQARFHGPPPEVLARLGLG